MFKDYKLNTRRKSGIHYVDNNILQFNNVVSTIKNNDLFRKLNENKKIKIINKNKIKINDELIEDVGFMIFI